MNEHMLSFIALSAIALLAASARVGAVTLVLALWSWGCAGGGGGERASAAASLVIDNGTLIDAQHGRALPDTRIVVRGARITCVGTRRSCTAPRGATMLDARNQWMATWAAIPIPRAPSGTGSRRAWSWGHASSSRAIPSMGILRSGRSAARHPCDT
jgi:hypothetical protein